MAREAFRDIFAVEWTDHGHPDSEERFALLGMAEHRLLFVSYMLRSERIRIISARLAEPYERRRYHNETKHDWSRADAMTDEQIHSAALADPDAQPLTDERLATMKPVPRSKTIRRALGLTQEQFAVRYHLSLGSLRDWEQGVCEPDQAARAYLRAIAGDPEAVQRALASKPADSLSGR